jgi:Helix-turn-helix domain
VSNKFLSLTWGLKPCGSPPQRLLLAALADHADESGKCWPGIELLQAETDLNPRTITRCLKSLEARKWITIERKSVGALHRGSAYVLDKDRLLAEQRTPDRVSPVQDATPDRVSGVQATNTTPTPDRVSGALEPPITPIRTTPLHVVPRKRDQREVPPFVLAEFIPADAWEDFEQHRIRKGKRLDDGQRWTLQKRLHRFHGEGQDVREIIENSIIGGWQGLFASTKKQYAAPAVTNPVQAIDKIRGTA